VRRLLYGSILCFLTLTVVGLVFIVGGITAAHGQPGDRLGVTRDEAAAANSGVLLQAVPSVTVTFPISATGPVSRTYFFPVQPASVAHYPLGHHDYPAADIYAPRESLFVAVTSGRIQDVSREDLWNSKVDDPALRGGRSVSLVGDDGVRYYGSHLDAVVAGLTPGQQVEAGQILGYVGSSGNARGGPTQLHFGISHPTFAGDWAVRRGELVPYVYLQAWQRGENLTPDLSGRKPGQK
jgi:peptidoglycan LD-endopeptidase LytH